jgi:hypothetical protein
MRKKDKDLYESRGCEFMPEVCEEDFSEEGEDFDKIENDYFGGENY